MKISPNDVSNQEILSELQKLSSKVGSLDGKVGSLETGQAEILETLQGLAEHMDQEFTDIRSEMVTKGELKAELSEFATKDDLLSEMGKLKTTMVTKGYLDDKLAVHHSEIILHTQREIAKALG